MSVHRLAHRFGVRAAWITPFLVIGMASATYADVAVQAGMEVMTRGPVHEAFAEVTLGDPTPGTIVQVGPPEPIAEVPPDERPEGANVAWVPGYWSWDDDQNNWIWVTGVWRVVPPGRQWVPGYWAPAGGGFQWTSGYWADVAQSEVEYLPPPPAPLEVNPVGSPPGPNYVWSQGCWIWRTDAYLWQPGYWVAEQPDWIWVPAHYQWSPRGYLFVPGYWDHGLARRGVLFAPVYYSQPLYATPGYFYSPSVVVDVGVLAACLFVRPRSHHYFFGDYYDPHYESMGIYPWYSKAATPYGWEPLYAHHRWHEMQHDPDWDRHIEEQFVFRRDHVDARPPRTLNLQVNLINTQKADVTKNLIIGRPLTEMAESKAQPLRFTRLNADERKRIETQGQEVHKFQTERSKLEAAPAAAVSTEKAANVTKLKLPASPVAAKAQAGAVAAPPPPTIPKLETTKKAPPAKVAVEGAPPAKTTVEAKPEKLQVTTPPKTTVKTEKLEAKPETKLTGPPPKTTVKTQKIETQAGKEVPTIKGEKTQKLEAKPPVKAQKIEAKPAPEIKTKTKAPTVQAKPSKPQVEGPPPKTVLKQPVTEKKVQKLPSAEGKQLKANPKAVPKTKLKAKPKAEGKASEEGPH